MASIFDSLASVEDHIPRQNEAGADIAEILRNYDSGIINTADAIRQIDAIADDFVDYTNRIGSDRALAGGKDIRTFADNLIAGFGAPVESSFSLITSGVGTGILGGLEQTLSGGGVIVPFMPQRQGPIDTMPVNAGNQGNGGTLLTVAVILGTIYALSKL